MVFVLPIGACEGRKYSEPLKVESSNLTYGRP